MRSLSSSPKSNTIPAIWFASVSVEPSWISVSSIIPECALWIMAHDSTTSSGNVVIIVPFEVSFMRCPALPTLWISLDTSLGDMYCTTWSTSPISIPSSIELVQISPFRSPDLNISSISILVSLDREP